MKTRTLRSLLWLLLLTWLSKDFTLLSSAIEFMNTLPLSQREKAYVIPLNSERSGLLNGYYTVIYPTF